MTLKTTYKRMNEMNKFNLQLFADGGEPAPETSASNESTPPTPPAPTEGTLPNPKPPIPPTNTILGGDNPKPPTSDPQNQSAIPEKYDFSTVIPEGMQADDKATQEFSAIAKKCNLTQEQASEIAKYGIGFSQHAIEQINQGYNNMVTGWANQTKQELGNDYSAVVANAGKGIEALEKQIPGLRQTLNETGVGNRVELVKAFSLLGQLTSEDNFRGFGGIVPHRDNLYENTDFSRYGS